MYSNMLTKIQYYDFITCNIDLFSAGLCEQRRFRADAVPRDTRAIEDRGPVSFSVHARPGIWYRIGTPAPSCCATDLTTVLAVESCFFLGPQSLDFFWTVAGL